MIRPIVAYPSDEVGAAATLTASVGADANYPLANAKTLDPMEIFLTAADITGGLWLLWHHPSKTDVKIVSIHGFNAPAGTNVRLQRNDTNVWTAPTMDVAVPIAAYPRIGLSEAVGVDLTLDDDYDDGFNYTRLYIPPLSQLIGIGSALLWGAKRETAVELLVNLRPMLQYPAIVRQTSGGRRLKYLMGHRAQAVGGEIPCQSPEYAAYLALFNAVGGAFSPFLWWMEPKDNTKAWLADFGSDVTDVQEQNNVLIARVLIQELGLGVAIPT